jgi:lipopolysaccharide transport system ATP-binding protein
MGKNIAIKVENLSKAYQLGQIGTGTISRDLERFWTTKIRGKEDPFLKIGEANDRSVKGQSDIVWSLKDINFQIEQGDAVGIIGRNGAGKSTLLKLLSRVTAPTTGNMRVKGRIASLLEVGTGFHPELTGRENIYLNGAILGMRKKEITRKFDEIVDFSGVERYIDTPVKRYSSGMYVRLAFAVAAHLESEILIVDEVLAVGDAEFQKKCLGKMGDVSKGEGRTILFVSHNMASITKLCTKGILLQNGCIEFSGDINSTIDKYSLLHNDYNNIKSVFSRELNENKDLELVSCNLSNGTEEAHVFDISEKIFVNLEIFVRLLVPGISGYIAIQTLTEELLIESDTVEYGENMLDNLNLGLNKYQLKLENNILPIGEYIVYLNFTSSFTDDFNVDSPREVVKFSIVDNLTSRNNNRMAKTSFIFNWQKVNE